MKSKTTSFAPPNSVVFISDLTGGEIPQSMSGKLIVSNDSCIAVGCRAEADGETVFILGPLVEIGKGRAFSFESTLKTPSKKVAIKSVLGNTILAITVDNEISKISILTNDTSEPNEVVVGVS